MTDLPGALQTARLALRLPRADDAGFILELLNDPGWLQNIGDRGVRNAADAARYIDERLLASFRRHGFGLWVMEPLGGGAPLGLCGLVKRDFLDDVDIGFALLPAARGQGLALEAARRVLRFATEELKLTRLLGMALSTNTASLRLLAALGLAFEKVLDEAGEPVHLYARQLP
jgi:[ribosomal protein S5]-alanine N-acetyltransferase